MRQPRPPLRKDSPLAALVLKLAEPEKRQWFSLLCAALITQGIPRQQLPTRHAACQLLKAAGPRSQPHSEARNRTSFVRLDPEVRDLVLKYFNPASTKCYRDLIAELVKHIDPWRIPSTVTVKKIVTQAGLASTQATLAADTGHLTQLDRDDEVHSLVLRLACPEQPDWYQHLTDQLAAMGISADRMPSRNHCYSALRFSGRRFIRKPRNHTMPPLSRDPEVRELILKHYSNVASSPYPDLERKLLEVIPSARVPARSTIKKVLVYFGVLQGNGPPAESQVAGDQQQQTTRVQEALAPGDDIDTK